MLPYPIRSWLGRSLVAGWLLTGHLFSCCSAQEPVAASAVQLTSPDINPFTTDEVDVAIERAIQFLLSQQKPTGSIADREHETAMTALSIMALAATGTTPSATSERGRAAQRALDFVLQEKRQDAQGYYGNADGSRMYGHGIITLMLTEMLGMGANEQQDHLVHEKCQKAINLILNAQQVRKHTPSHRGGWRYTPDAQDSDLSVSVWQVMALRSAKNDGLDVPTEAIEEAIGYLRRSYTQHNPQQKDNAGFAYLPDQHNPTFAMTAAGLLAMQVCGQYESPLTHSSAEWLLRHPPKWEERFALYGTYYYAQGMYQRGGEHAATAERFVRDLLLPKQQSNGCWESPTGEEQSAGKVYATCMAVLSLSVKHHYLPIYQR
jgi:hypothetical protein